jgi:hypothetical protein
MDMAKLVLRVPNNNGGFSLETITLHQDQVENDPYEITIQDVKEQHNNDDSERNYEVSYKLLLPTTTTTTTTTTNIDNDY